MDLPSAWRSGGGKEYPAAHSSNLEQAEEACGQEMRNASCRELEQSGF